ncbi:tripartite motif-containing protein 45 [Patella vulgata]|uniref:tripartite motif-containing protein 45 n=1 Tax=Patella vulgata TaxID=6465 RepID=UPI00217FFA65|nr:tripartite motif-containing protein 45 [Patella vulgata]
MAEERNQVCVFCLDDFVDPKILDCQHSFCLKCLDDYITRSSKNNQFQCPVCRRTVQIPAGGVNDFPSPKVSPTEITTHMCPAHNDKPVGYFCQDCFQSVCYVCASTTHRGHTFLPLEDTSEPGPEGLDINKDRCPKHKHAIMNYYCKKCSVLVCADCFIADHNGHLFLNKKVYQKELREKLRSLNGDLKNEVSKLETYYESLTTGVSQTEKLAKKTSDSIDQQVKKICREVERLGEAMKTRMLKGLDEGKTKVDTQKKDTSDFVERLKLNVIDNDRVLQDKYVGPLLVQTNKSRTQQKESSSRKLDVLSLPGVLFEAGDIDKVPLSQAIGSLYIINTVTVSGSFNVDQVVTKGWFGNVWRESLKQTNNDLTSFIRVSRDSSTLYVQLIIHNTFRHDIRQIKFKMINHKDESKPKIERGPHIDVDWSELTNPDNGFLDEQNNFSVQYEIKLYTE